MPLQERHVTPLELFFDLVFVFALTEVTTFLADDPTWHGLAPCPPPPGRPRRSLRPEWTPTVYLAGGARRQPARTAGAPPLGLWRLQPAHFVERHSLIIIIALGESLIAIGAGARGTSITASVVVAALLGLAVAASFWIAYFDFFTIRLHQLLAERRGSEQIALARDTYSYLHLPMVIGIVLSAFGMRDVLVRVGGDLHAVPALALALVAAVWIGLHTYEIVWWRESRAETRALGTAALDRTAT